MRALKPGFGTERTARIPHQLTYVSRRWNPGQWHLCANEVSAKHQGGPEGSLEQERSGAVLIKM